MPSFSAKQRGQQMQRLDLRIAAIGGQFLARWTASWALMVSLSKRNGHDRFVRCNSRRQLAQAIGNDANATLPTGAFTGG